MSYFSTGVTTYLHLHTVNSNRMSSGGTQSPPLEFTDSHRPMGVSSIDGSVSEPMLDAEQRKTYFAEPEPKERGVPKEAGKEQRKESAKEKQ